MNDQELLTYAAKAAGYSNPTWDDDIWLHDESKELHQWNPLEDDADAFQLMVKLGMMVDARYTNPVSKRYNRVVYWDNPKAGKTIEFGDAEMDEYALARRAIVMAAAEIGKGM